MSNTYPWPPSGNVGVGTTSPSATLHVVGQFMVAGSQVVTIATTTINVTLDATYHIVVVDTTSGTLTVTLPAASTYPGIEYRIKNKGPNPALVSGGIYAASAGFITLNVQESVTIVSDGTYWYLV